MVPSGSEVFHDPTKRIFSKNHRCDPRGPGRFKPVGGTPLILFAAVYSRETQKSVHCPVQSRRGGSTFPKNRTREKRENEVGGHPDDELQSVWSGYLNMNRKRRFFNIVVQQLANGPPPSSCSSFG